ncbi:MAG TPA: nucleotidyltransferase family protein [Caulobacteraceae bacterium]|nr:nucleotidyltransferase family protein [Caulobacteraceae bacterium]
MAEEAGRSARLESIVLAAGAGTRFGGEKLTAPYHDGLLIDGALGAAFAAPGRTVTVTIGADPKVAAAARAFAERRGEAARLKLLPVADHARGMGVSLATAVASLPKDAAGVFVFLGDMPETPHAMAAALARALEAGAMAAAPTHAGRRGHPALFANALFPRLSTLGGDEGARAVLAGLGQSLALVETDDPGVLFDVDERL